MCVCVLYSVNFVKFVKNEIERLSRWRRSLQRTLAELRDYQQKHDSWKQQQQKLVSEQAPRPEKIEQTISYETYKLRLANEGIGQYVPYFAVVTITE